MTGALEGLFRAAHLSEIRRVANEKIVGDLYADADGANFQLVVLATEIGKRFPGLIFIPGPVKGEARARQKTAWDYSGDFFSLKDVVRMTMIAKDQQALADLREVMRKYCIAANGYSLIKDAETFANVEACGYSGLNLVVKLPLNAPQTAAGVVGPAMPYTGRPAEIQANVPQIMYGKMSKKSFCKSFGESEHARIQASYQVEGGLGHKLYEVYRENLQGKAQAAAMLSKLYYAYLRSAPNQFRRTELDARIPGFKAQFSQLFVEH